MTLPLVLLPGMMCDGRLFGPQIGAFGDRHCFVGSLASASDVGSLADDVLADAPGLFALAGLSMGGIVAMEIVRKAPDRVAALALLDTNPRAEAEDVAARRVSQVAAARDGRLEEVMRVEMKPNYLADGPDRARILDLCMDMALGLGPEVFARQSAALATRPDQQQALAAYDGPSLVLMGAEDRLCPRDRHEGMHALLSASTFEVIDGAGHLPTLEQPAATTAALADWLARAES